MIPFVYVEGGGEKGTLFMFQIKTQLFFQVKKQSFNQRYLGKIDFVFFFQHQRLYFGKTKKKTNPFLFHP